MDYEKQEQEKVQWLRSVYQEVPQGCPLPKQVKLSDVHEQLEERYAKCSHYQLATLLQKAFPNAESKIAGKSRTKHIIGIRPVVQIPDPITSKQSIAQLTEQLKTERAQNVELLEKMHFLEARIRELESTSPSHLATQVDTLPQSSLAASGPDSYVHFCEFTVEGMIRELQKQVPDVYGFFMHLGDVSRNVGPDGASTQELKAITALCTLMNARSSRVKGMQLLISIMLIARSTSKQVGERMHTHNNTMTVSHACTCTILFICRC